MIQDNVDGWGPCAVPDQFRDIPYQPFSKGDRIGKVSDWTGSAYQDRKYSNKYASQFGAGTQYAYYHEGDESSFQLVDTSKPHKTAYQRNKQRFNNAKLKRERERQQRKEAIMMGQTQNKGKMRGKFQKNWHRGRYNDRQNTQKNRNASVAVREEWKGLEDMDFPRLSKLKLPGKGNVFATDAIISTLMTCTRSVHSWDVVVQRVGNKLFFDKRDDSEFDLLTVYETAWDPPQDEGNSINSPHNLALEATFINHNFSQQVLKPVEKPEDRLSFEKPEDR